jgi:hypothetical protein
MNGQIGLFSKNRIGRVIARRNRAVALGSGIMSTVGRFRIEIVSRLIGTLGFCLRRRTGSYVSLRSSRVSIRVVPDLSVDVRHTQAWKPDRYLHDHYNPEDPLPRFTGDNEGS